jgi:integrase/recombinase XerD
MLSAAVSSYLALRRAAGFGLKHAGQRLESFAAYSDRQDRPFVHAATAIEWAGQSNSRHERSRRLGDVARMARFLHAEDERHEIPPAVFGSRSRARPTPFILADEQIAEIVRLAARSGYRTLRRQTYSTLFALLACTGLRLGEAIQLRYADITPDGLMIRATKFNKNRLVPLHETARAGLEGYLQQRRPYAPDDDHVFVSLRRKPLLHADVEYAFRKLVAAMGLPVGRGNRRPTPHSLRHAFAVRALRTCPDGRDHITQHMLLLATYLGHSKAELTYWYLESVPELMREIAERCQAHVFGSNS